MKKLKKIEDLIKLNEKLKKNFKNRFISISSGTCARARGSLKLIEALKKEAEGKIDLKITGCHGFCEAEPNIIIFPEEIFYRHCKPEDAKEIIEKTILKGELIDRLLCKSTDGKESYKTLQEIPFYKKQLRNLLQDNPFIDPTEINDFILKDGYISIAKALKMEPEQIINAVKNSGLRGRGGAGFPTGKKWELCRKHKEKIKYIICNADEGDPGAYMDRNLLESKPHQIIEGMIIGAYAIGAKEGYIYVRNEYPLAVKHIQKAIEDAKSMGLLGENILGTDFSFDIKIIKGAGAFVCGEETALIASIEGKRGTPQQRPPYPVEKGLFRKPTVINNVETWANVPLIINNGAEWFSSIGTETSKGTKIFSLVGKVKNTGLVEVPMGITLKEIIYEIGGGLFPQRNFKAVQTGGPSGGCLPIDMIDSPIDYESLQKAGSIMGSGGMIVMDDHTCMVDVAKYFLTFLQDESCGKCLPCRKGTQKLLEIVKDITEGRGKLEDLETLEDLGKVIKDTSLCGLGQTAPNPVLATLRYFRKEYEDHILRKKCSAAICREIVSSPCQHICPIDTKASTYIALIAQKRFKEAFDVVKMDNPLSSTVARVCHHPCETYCRAGEGGDPISIRGLKKFLTDMGIKKGWYKELKKVPKNGKKVAIIGSGPAGLACAFSLSQKGYNVTIFEKEEKLGGVLQYGIPAFRLPKDILKADIDYILSSGIDVKTGKTFGKDFSIQDLKKEGFDSIFLGLGAQKSQKLGLKGEDAKGVEDGIKILKIVNEGKDFPFGERVGVLGGGHSAVDIARTAIRSKNVKEVTIFYRRTLEEMPAFRDPDDVYNAMDEGVKIVFLSAPKEIKVENGKLKGMVFQKMKLGDIEPTGRRRPEPIEGEEFFVELDNLIVSIGERCDTDFIKEMGLEVNKNMTLKVDSETLQTSMEGVFAGGDIVMGPSSVIESIAQGKIAAESIDKYLKGEEIKREYGMRKPPFYVEPVELSEEEVKSNIRTKAPNLPVEERKFNFKEVELEFSEEDAIKEARRCLRCDLETAEAKRFLESLEKKEA
ncbi:MAG: NADH-quinone oxidoreductase subunit NuoF [Thermoanaerobaculia bacterium]